MSQTLHRNIAPRGIILLILIALLPQSSSCSEEKKEPPSYKATTVEECINEEACVWDYFQHLAFGAEFGSEGMTKDEENMIKKYPENRYPIVTHTGDNEFFFDNFLPVVEEIFPKIRKVTGKDMQVNNPTNPPPNILIIIDGDPDDGISKKNTNLINKLTNEEGWFERQLKSIREHSTTDTFSFISSDGLSLKSSIIFIKKYEEQRSIRVSLIEEIIQSIGLSNDYQGAPFTRFNDLNDKVLPTKLDWLLLGILYNDSIKIGMTPEEAKQVFHQAYEESKLLLNSMEKEDVN